ncbi:hypothetical protein AOQ84DRAFT_303434 [Glonium stellatum]|uniref:Uncharacterized protein n=1 Tax=Glonium stellatum TaxID=574774 RepID=A0A8E2EQN5_9PEZI|nr:hypothetical protein AOQ84DRAFT_303434 [Glonium stellatum]
MPGSYGPSLPQMHDKHTGRPSYFFAPPPHGPAVTRRAGRQLGELGGFQESKKRSRHGISDAYFTTQYSTKGDRYSGASIASSIDRSAGAKSPPPLASTKYLLSGGTETPPTFANALRDDDEYNDLEYRRGIWTAPTSPALGSVKSAMNAEERLESSQNGTNPWVLSQLLNLVGGVAGKMWQFCRVPFQGFHAGGGQGYNIDTQGKITDSSLWEDIDPNPMKIFESHTPLPGRFPEENFGVRSIASIASAEDTPVRSSKRLCTHDGWVMVGNVDNIDSRASSPRLSERRTPSIAKAHSPSQIPRPVQSRIGSGTRGSSTRPSLLPVSRRTSHARTSTTYHSGSPAVRPNKSVPSSSPRAREYSRQSYTSPVLFQGHNTSPLPPDSQRLINKIRRDEMEEEARMRKMSAQAKAMLKEAREALGTKYEIEDVDEFMNL